MLNQLDQSANRQDDVSAKRVAHGATPAPRGTGTMSSKKWREETPLKPNSIVFVRRRMLYARPAFNGKGEVRFGLRHIRTQWSL